MDKILSYITKNGFVEFCRVEIYRILYEYVEYYLLLLFVDFIAVFMSNSVELFIELKMTRSPLYTMRYPSHLSYNYCFFGRFPIF